MDERLERESDTMSDSQPNGDVIAVMERSKFWLLADGRLALVANSRVSHTSAMHERERDLFEEDLWTALNAIKQVMEPDNTTPERDEDESVEHLTIIIMPRNPRRLSNELDAAGRAALIGDLREAMGYIRERVTVPELVKYLDNQGRVVNWPHKRYEDGQMAVRRYMASKFEMDRQYTEKEVNAILKQWHTFEDWALLRRELFMWGFFGRLKDGSAYWLKSYEPTLVLQEDL